MYLRNYFLIVNIFCVLNNTLGWRKLSNIELATAFAIYLIINNTKIEPFVYQQIYILFIYLI